MYKKLNTNTVKKNHLICYKNNKTEVIFLETISMSSQLIKDSCGSTCINWPPHSWSLQPGDLPSLRTDNSCSSAGKELGFIGQAPSSELTLQSLNKVDMT